MKRKVHVSPRTLNGVTLLEVTRSTRVGLKG